MAELRCMPLKQLTDGPLMLAPEGTLSTLVNMRLRPGGYGEARGGMEKLKPSGGSATDPISAGGTTAGLQAATSFGWVRTFNFSGGAGNQYSGNTQLATGGYRPFPTDALGDAIYFGAQAPFGRIGMSLSVAAVFVTMTVVYEYWNGAWTAFAATPETIDWTISPTPQYASWTMPTDWVATAIGDSGSGNVLQYWMRIRLTNSVTLTTPARVRTVYGYWTGTRDFYIATQSPRSGATSGSLFRYGQSGTTAEWFAVNSAVSSMPASPNQMAFYNGRVYMVNGRDQKRWDGAYYQDIGALPFTQVPTLIRQAGAGMDVGIWRYYGAWGSGPCRFTGAYSAQLIADPMYGVGRATLIVPTGGADPADANSIQTTAGNQQIVVGIPTPPQGASAYYVYRTQDLTSVPVSKRATFPAFLVQSLRIRIDQLNFEPNGVGTYIDASPDPLFPPLEADLFDNSPPARCKYVSVYQNRLFLASNDQFPGRVWWSKAFFADLFDTTLDYVELTRAHGGRITGMIEFADQMVVFTENQTWGLSNVDLDVPQLYPIHSGVGCVAPMSPAVGDGLLVWMARDGFYVWDGSRKLPTKISGKMNETFKKLSFESHGGSRAVIHNHRYDVRLGDPTNPQGTMYSLDLQTFEWSTFTPSGGVTSTMAPLCVINAPLGHADFGVPHPIFCKVDPLTGAGDYAIYLGEYTTADNGTGYSCQGVMYFPQAPGETFSPSRALAYYQADAGWGTPSLTAVAGDIGQGAVGTITTGTPDSGTDYSVVGGTYGQQSSGTSDLKLNFSVTSATGGSINQQRLFGAVLEGSAGEIRQGHL